MVTTGLALAGLGLVALGFVHADTVYGNVWWRLAIAGIGFGLTMSPLPGAAIQAVSPQEGGLASGISSTTRQIGAVLGVAVLGAIVRTAQSHGASFEDGLNSVFRHGRPRPWERVGVAVVLGNFGPISLSRYFVANSRPLLRRSGLTPVGDHVLGGSGDVGPVMITSRTSRYRPTGPPSGSG